jgi:hypothetical protein
MFDAARINMDYYIIQVDRNTEFQLAFIKFINAMIRISVLKMQIKAMITNNTKTENAINFRACNGLRRLYSLHKSTNPIIKIILQISLKKFITKSNSHTVVGKEHLYMTQ